MPDNAKNKNSDYKLFRQETQSLYYIAEFSNKSFLFLTIYQNLSYEEISEIMDIGYQVALNLFSHAIKSLRRIL